MRPRVPRRLPARSTCDPSDLCGTHLGNQARPPQHRHDDKWWANVVNVRKFCLFVLSMQVGAGHHPEAGFTSHCGRKRSAE